MSRDGNESSDVRWRNDYSIGADCKNDSPAKAPMASCYELEQIRTLIAMSVQLYSTLRGRMTSSVPPIYA
ncbi:hypothetical protein EU537_05435 [Candidatus Thorarchaeota archaeon]|nr:MAG: hypothetical protein EU537_05435 [Candidatus Thorarchaeota archaeon]